MPDTEISLLDRCTGRQIKELLALASTDLKVSRHWLVEVAGEGNLCDLLTQMIAPGDQPARVLLEAVCSRESSIETLTRIKSVAKRLAVHAATPAQKAAATLLYHLAVASALAHHGRNISSKDSAGRLALYKELASEAPDDRLASLFAKAAAHSAGASK